MTYWVDVQHATEDTIPVSDETLIHWAAMAASDQTDTFELTLRLVSPEEILHLNKIYRKINKITNVLAFPANYPKHIELDYPLFGDVILCPKVLLEESQALQKPLIAHWAHIVIHGVLHLLGYDHVERNDEAKMQAIEIELLATLGFENPYEVNEIE